jgi:hypothetical protein
LIPPKVEMHPSKMGCTTLLQKQSHCN